MENVYTQQYRSAALEEAQFWTPQRRGGTHAPWTTLGWMEWRNLRQVLLLSPYFLHYIVSKQNTHGCLEEKLFDFGKTKEITTAI